MRKSFHADIEEPFVGDDWPDIGIEKPLPDDVGAGIWRLMVHYTICSAFFLVVTQQDDIAMLLLRFYVQFMTTLAMPILAMMFLLFYKKIIPFALLWIVAPVTLVASVHLLPRPAIVGIGYLLTVWLSYCIGKHWLHLNTSWHAEPWVADRIRRDGTRWLIATSFLAPFIWPVLLPFALWNFSQGFIAIASFMNYNRAGIKGPGLFESPSGPCWFRVLLFDAAVVVIGSIVGPYVLLAIVPVTRSLSRESLV